MKLRSLYNNYYRNNLFNRLLLLFSCITVLTIVTLSYFLFSSMRDSIVNGRLDYQKRAIESVDAYMNERYESVKLMITEMYRDSLLSDNVYYLLKHPYEDYVKYRLDKYVTDERTAAANGLQYFHNNVQRNPDIGNLLLYSAERQFLVSFGRTAGARVIETNAAHSYIPDIMAMEGDGISAPNPWLRQAADQHEPGMYAVRTPVIDMRTYKNIGQLTVLFESKGIRKAIRSYESQLAGYVLVMAADGQVLFDSSNRYYGGRYPYADRITPLRQTADLEEASYVSELSRSGAGYIVVGVTPVREMAAAYRGLKRTILAISSACILIAILIPGLFVASFAKRTNNIIRFTRKVRAGDFTSRIQEEREDELGQISRSFNGMVDELVRHIDTVYKAEIKQKHTELAALQARVNPHFLYNTLEVIRMRAVSQGARDVAEMIYSLSALFRNQVREKAVYTLKDEMEACRLYLELFRIRYKDKFAYELEWEPGLDNARFMRMSLQPIIENYIVHGVRTASDDNWLKVRIGLRDGMILAEIRDNGRGIPPDRLRAVAESLQVPKQEDGSFGLASVSERLRLLYGERAGMELHSTEGEGTTVLVRFPAEIEEGAEQQHV